MYPACSLTLGKVERSLAFFDGHGQPLAKYVQAAVVGQLEVIHACHHTRQVVIRCVRRFAGPAHHREDGGETLESYRNVLAYAEPRAVVMI